MTVERRDWPDLAGRLTGDGHELPVRVYYEDTDFSGLVYHAAYLRFMERGRSDFLRMRGIHHRHRADGAFGESLAFVARHMEITFLRPARIDMVLLVETRMREISGARTVLDQRIRAGDELLVEAGVTIALINRDGRPRRLPAAIRQALAGGGPS